MSHIKVLLVSVIACQIFSAPPPFSKKQNNNNNQKTEEDIKNRFHQLYCYRSCFVADLVVVVVVDLIVGIVEFFVVMGIIVFLVFVDAAFTADIVLLLSLFLSLLMWGSMLFLLPLLLQLQPHLFLLLLLLQQQRR